jgi:hypothetical protein
MTDKEEGEGGGGLRSLEDFGFLEEESGKPLPV